MMRWKKYFYFQMGGIGNFMKLTSKKGAALLQVLLVTAVLAGITTMLLRVTLSRASTARQVRRTVSAQILVESCMAEVNALWAAKSAEAYARDINQCIMYCNDADIGGSCTGEDPRYTYTCSPQVDGTTYTVTATMSGSNGACQVNYEVGSATNL